MIVNRFQVGDMVRLKADSWLNNEQELMRFGFTEPSIDKAYEVTHVCESINSISLRGNNSLYFSSYFELAKTEQTDVLSIKPDAVNHPKHYAVFEQLEAIEVIASSMTTEQFYGYCLGNILKYRLRAGGKDDVIQELGKADKYQELFTQFKSLCKDVK